MKKPLVELIGTFFLVFTIGMTVVPGGDAVAMAPVAIGLVLAAMIYAGGHISGAHYNPAITIAILIRGACPARDVLPYILAQVAGAALASFVVMYLTGDTDITAGSLDLLPALVAEFLFTFALAFVILNVATAKANEGNSFYGLAIGGIVLAGAYAVGPVSGAAFNPAVALGVCIMGLASWSAVWVYLVANFAGAVAAAFVFKAVGEDKKA